MSLAMLFDSEFVEQSTSKREIILMATKEEKQRIRKDV